MRLAILEPLADGHHMSYVRLVAEEALQRDWTVTLVTTEGTTRHPAYESVREECDGLKTIAIPDFPHVVTSQPVRLLVQQYRHFRAYAAAVRRVCGAERPDFIYLVNLDFCDKALAALGSAFGATLFGGMLMTSRFYYREVGLECPPRVKDSVDRLAFWRLLRIRRLRALTTLNPLLVDYIQRVRPPGFEKVRYVPDAALVTGVCPRSRARHSLGLTEGQRAVLVYGSLTPRKGIDALLAAAAHPACSPEMVVLLVGQQSPEVHSLLAGPAARRLRSDGRLIEVTGFVVPGSETEYRAFMAADMAWLAYTGFYGMSGVLVQSCSMGLPLIASQAGLIGWLTLKYGLGETVAPLDEAAVLRAFDRLGDPIVAGQYARAGRDFASRHTPGHFARAVCDACADGLKNGQRGSGS
jgi:glycosyltransferase involved in cell wall biosynthesis